MFSSAVESYTEIDPNQEKVMTKRTPIETKPGKTPASLNSLKSTKDNKARVEKLSIQNNPDSLPWIKNKVIKDSVVGKKKSG
jgi:hypothetical protein